jgi:hypothetical protein
MYGNGVGFYYSIDMFVCSFIFQLDFIIQQGMSMNKRNLVPTKRYHCCNDG